MDFKLKLPIMDKGIWWNGKPYAYSNLPKWACVYAQGFGENKLPLYKELGLKGHNGLDIAYAKGTPVVAPIRCFVTIADNGNEGYGKYVRASTETIDGEYLELTFGHFDEVVVGANKWVEEGTILGYGDSTGYSTGHHLHFGIRIHETLPNGNSQIKNYNNGYWGGVDPEPYLPKCRWTFGELEQLKEKNMITYRKVGEPAVYFAVGTKLIPFATTWENYLIDFEDAVLVELSEEEFAKFTIAQAVEVKAK